MVRIVLGWNIGVFIVVVKCFIFFGLVFFVEVIFIVFVVVEGIYYY